MNMDETELAADEITEDKSSVIVPKSSKRPLKEVSTKREAHYTLIYTVFADGSCCPVVWIKSGGQPRESTAHNMMVGKTHGAVLFGSSNSHQLFIFMIITESDRL